MLKSEFSSDVTVGMLIALYESAGISVEVNDGKVSNVKFFD